MDRSRLNKIMMLDIPEGYEILAIESYTNTIKRMGGKYEVANDVMLDALFTDHPLDGQEAIDEIKSHVIPCIQEFEDKLFMYDEEAAFMIGYEHLKDIDLERALIYLQYAADRGSVRAKYVLGKRRFKMDPYNQDGLYELEGACSRGDSIPRLVLAKCLLSKFDDELINEGERLLSLACKDGLKAAKFYDAIMDLISLEDPTDKRVNRAVKPLVEMAEDGYTQGYEEIALALFGEDIGDRVMVWDMLKKAASLGSCECASIIADCFFKSYEEEDYDDFLWRALPYARIAARGRKKSDSLLLADILYELEGSCIEEKSFEMLNQAYRIYEEYSNKGDAHAIDMFGRISSSREYYEKALRHYQLALSQGDSDAIYHMAEIDYEFKKDINCIKTLIEGSEKGIKACSKTLAKVYHDGIIVPRNEELSKKYELLAMGE